MTLTPTITFEQVRFVKDEPVVLKSGKHSIQKVTHHWCPCDECGQGTYVNDNDLKAPWSCPECGKEGSRKDQGDKVPMCKGRTLKGEKIIHEPVPMTSFDPNPGRPCRMTPRCKGKHRKGNP